MEHTGSIPANLEELVNKDEAGRGPYLNSQTILDPWANLTIMT